MVLVRNGAESESPRLPDSRPISEAGLRSLDHYQRKLPRWRFKLRQRILPMIRWETPYLAWLQSRTRCFAFDQYFAITATLGTPTCFMIGLPMLFWCGQTSIGRGMVRVLQFGVIFTGFVKDMLSLPRPLSPPLHRITMSGTAALEYGLPSTHSTNAVSVATYALLVINSTDYDSAPLLGLGLQIMFYIYVASIVFGRLYCGMHGFIDIVVGSALGALISVVDFIYVSKTDTFWYNSSWLSMAVLAAVMVSLIIIHPEPADDCPCFDDSVASAGVVIGVEVGGWHYAASKWASSSPVPATVPFDFRALGWGIIGARVLVGIFIIFAWRYVMKRICFQSLPPLFRVIEHYGLDRPRKFFMPASQYSFIPSRLEMDNILPSMSDVLDFVRSIRHPERVRRDSIGPQSAADAYEAIAYREKQRRDSLSSMANKGKGTITSDHLSLPGNAQMILDTAQSSAFQNPINMISGNNLPTPVQSRVGSYEHMRGQGSVAAPATPPSSDNEHDVGGTARIVEKRDAAEEDEMFSNLEKPRERYDVEVVTKLVVYAGIGWLSVETIPIIFEIIGLGMGQV